MANFSFVLSKCAGFICLLIKSDLLYQLHVSPLFSIPLKHYDVLKDRFSASFDSGQ